MDVQSRRHAEAQKTTARCCIGDQGQRLFCLGPGSLNVRAFELIKKSRFGGKTAPPPPPPRRSGGDEIRSANVGQL